MTILTIMSALLANRVQSAYPRSSANNRTSSIQARPTSSAAAHRSSGDIFGLTEWGRASSSTPVGIRGNSQQPRTAGISASNSSSQFAFGQLQADEIDSLLQTIDRDDGFVVEVDCLADYRKLVETLNLRRTPMDWKSLYALQKRENRIIQRNACRDRRFQSLLKSLGPKQISDKNDTHAKESKYKHIIEASARLATSDQR